jgi:hypothetical protein
MYRQKHCITPGNERYNRRNGLSADQVGIAVAIAAAVPAQRIATYLETPVPSGLRADYTLEITV